MGKPRALPFRPFMGLYGDPKVFPCHSLSLVGHNCDAKCSNVCTRLHVLMDLRRDMTLNFVTELCDLSLLHRSYIVFVLYSYVTFHLGNLVFVFVHNSGVIQTNGNGVP